MKKSEELQFAEPTRQSLVAIVLIIYKYINVIIRQIWPFLIIFLVGGGSGYKSKLTTGLIVVALASMLWAILSYFKFYFYLKNDELIIQRGILKKSNLNIPLDRIQSVNINQNIVHQILNVVQLEVDTAGTKGAEFKFDALSKDQAEILRSILISRKTETLQNQGQGESLIDQSEVVEERKPILNLSFLELIKVGMSQNHFRSIGVVMLVFFWIQSSIEDIGIETDKYTKEFFDFLISASFKAVMTMIVMASVVAVGISLVRTILVYFDAHLWREGSRLKLSYGLFNKKEMSALYQKIQILQWGNNPLQKLLKIFDVRLKQASSSVVSAKSSLRIPGCTEAHIQYLKDSWLGDEALANLEIHGISIHYFYRRVLFRMIFCATLFGIYFLIGQINGWLIFLILLVPYFIYTSWLSYKKSGFAVNHSTLYVTKGMLDDDYALLPLAKVQNVIINQTPYQSRRNLATINVHTASGSISIPYIPYSLAEQLSDYFMYRVESSVVNWM